MDIYTELIETVKSKELSNSELLKLKRSLCVKYKVSQPPTNFDILLHAKPSDLNKIKSKLMLKPTRISSGVAPIAIMTAPFPCPHGKCVYCPGGPGSYFGDVPQSYTGYEPTTMRAMRNKYDSYLQVFNRLEQYIAIGHAPNKVELIVMGGTFPSLPLDYQNKFITGAFKAMNDFSDMFYKDGGELNFTKFKQFFELPGEVGAQERTENIHKKLLSSKLQQQPTTLEFEHKRNETAKIRCVTLCIETRPDYGKFEHGNIMLKQGCTRIELGVETVYGDVLMNINRGHSLKDTKDSISILRDLGFKIGLHYMPGLPGVDEKKDIDGFKELFDNPDYRPDMLKIYPCMVSPGTALYEDWSSGKFTPLTAEQAAERIAKIKPVIPRYCRIQRIQRDVPTKQWSAGVELTNLRQFIHQKYHPKCQCIRCREPRGNYIDVENAKLDISEYEASGGKEFFISMNDVKNDLLLGFCRLRFPYKFLREEITKDSAIVRELHVYGLSTPIGQTGNVQHRGFGKLLLKTAEGIAKEHGKNKLLVISGIGARQYYYKLGYGLDGVYVSKKLA